MHPVEDEMVDYLSLKGRMKSDLCCCKGLCICDNSAVLATSVFGFSGDNSMKDSLFWKVLLALDVGA